MPKNRNNPRLRVLFNDTHSNLPSSKFVTQGGPSSFAKVFYDYTNKKGSEAELISLLFTHNTKNKNLYVRATKKDREIYEIVYPKELLIESYKKKYTKKAYLEFLVSPLKKIDEVLEQANPDVVFLNGFSLSNWLILEAAYRRNIPICIQHAGIWKKELLISQEHFSPSIKKIFSSMEKETISKASHQIFLNEFSRDVFFKMHSTPKTKKLLAKTSIVPLPISRLTTHKPNIKNKNRYSIGMVARWDSIKNHGAIARLAAYVQKKNLPLSVCVVTKWSDKLVSNFKDKYEKLVKIVSPMSQADLKKFYASQDLCIIPSRFDVSPTVLMEAVSLGKPVIISSSVGWVSDYKKFSLSDLIISPNASGKTIFKTIEKLIVSKNKYLPRFALLQNKIIRDHNPEVIFHKYYQILKNISYEHTK